MLHSRSEELIEALISKALEGDIAAMKLVFDRLVPPLKAVDTPIELPRVDGDITAQAEVVVGHLLSGGLAPDQAGRIMQSLQTYHQMVMLQDLERRIAALESANDTENQN
jgi:hypothetical protein